MMAFTSAIALTVIVSWHHGICQDQTFTPEYLASLKPFAPESNNSVPTNVVDELKAKSPTVSEPIIFGAPKPAPGTRLTKTCTCGTKTGGVVQPRAGPGAFATLRILQGEETEVHEFPWAVALVRTVQTQSYNWFGYPSTQTSYVQFCGGALINDRYVITASHCVQTKTANGLQVLLADHRLDTQSEASTIVRGVSRIIKNPNFNIENYQNDIALLKLNQPVPFSRDIVPTCLPSIDSYSGKTATVAGWGKTSEGGVSSTSLLKVDLTVMSLQNCLRRFRGTRIAVVDSQVCAIGANGQDSCNGDSGGPLVVNQNGKYELIGLVSFGVGCGSTFFPGVYTNVNSFSQWIADNAYDGYYCSS